MTETMTEVPKEQAPETTTETTATDTAAEAEDKALISDDAEGDDAKGEEKPEAEEERTPLTSEDITFAEGMEIDEGTREAFLDTLNQLNAGDLTLMDAAQRLVDLQTTLAKTAADSLAEAWETTQASWREQAEAHPEFGGEKLKPVLADIKLMIDEAGGDQAKEVYEALALTGAGNHPAVIGLMAKLAKDYKEGRPTTGDIPAAPTDLASRMFPNQGKK